MLGLGVMTGSQNAILISFSSNYGLRGVDMCSIMRVDTTIDKLWATGLL